MAFSQVKEDQVYIGDTATLEPVVFEEDNETPVPITRLASVSFTIKKPSDPTDTPSIVAQPGIITDRDGVGQFIVSGSVTTEPGQYRAAAQFTLTDGRKKTVIVDFNVDSAFSDIPTIFKSEDAVQLAWLKLTDLFDNSDGGPWLREKSLNGFDIGRVHDLVPDALSAINNPQPITNYDENTFPYNEWDGKAIFAQALLVATIKHLMRSYTEQPDVMNSPQAYYDRRRYAQAWGQILQVEEATLKEWLKGFKLRHYASGSKILIGTKAGRLMPVPMRVRFPARWY